MTDLFRAVIQFACEASIYSCERILETLQARRPDHGDPLPDTYPQDLCCGNRGGRMESDGPMASHPIGLHWPPDNAFRAVCNHCNQDHPLDYFCTPRRQ